MTWRRQEAETWYHAEHDAHVWCAGGVWWWATGEDETLRCGSEDTREAAQDAALESLEVSDA